MIWELIGLAVISAILQYLDATAGMGYGGMTPLLIILGFAPLEAIPAIILTSAVLSLFAGLLHYGFKNVDFRIKGRPFKITSILIGFGIMGMILAVFLATHIPEIALKIYIGVLVIVIGVIVMIHRKKGKFSWWKLVGFGSLASFNKGMSGGGFGPVVASGQIITGVNAKKAVAITALTEGVISAAGIALFFVFGESGLFNWSLIVALLIGGAIATPLAVLTVKKINPEKLKYVIGSVSVVLGIIVILQMFL